MICCPGQGRRHEFRRFGAYYRQIIGKERGNHAGYGPCKTCIQCGLCPAVCPDVFTLEPGEPARAISGPVPEECRLAAQEAADSCPVGAIEVR